MKKRVIPPPPSALYLIILMLMSYINVKLYAQNARDVHIPTKTCIDCILIDYDNSNNTTGTPPTNVGTLPSGLTGSFSLIFADEFNSSSVELMPAPTNFNTSPKKWQTFSVGAGQSIDISTNTDFTVSNGTLKLIQRLDGNSKFNTTQFMSNAYIRYGYFEARIKIPNRTQSPTRLLPAFWLYRNNIHPDYCIYEEMDIFEFVQGSNVGSNTSGSISGVSTKSWYQTHEHYDRFNQYPCEDGYRTAYGRNIIPLDDDPSGGAFRLDMTKDFFIWGVHWRQDSIIYYLNNKRVGGFPEDFVLDPTKQVIGMNIILNCGVHNPPMDNGMMGNPTQMEIDYVRVYKENNDFSIASLSQICIGPSGYQNHWAVEDYLPGATYQFAILKPNGIDYLLNPVNATADVYKYYLPVNIANGTPSGTYTVKLTLNYPHPVTGANVNRVVTKPLVIAPYVLPSTPTINASATLNRCQTFSIGNYQTGYIYSWWADNLDIIPQSPSPTGSGTWRVCCGEQISGTLNGTIHVVAHNFCGESPTRHYTVNTNCYCPNCTVRQKSDSLEKEMTYELIENCKKENLPFPIEMQKSSQFKISPNPCDERLWIENALQNPIHAAIYTKEGFLCRQEILIGNQAYFYTGDIPQGIYYLKIRDHQHVATTFIIHITH